MDIGIIILVVAVFTGGVTIQFARSAVAAFKDAALLDGFESTAFATICGTVTVAMLLLALDAITNYTFAL